MKKWELCASFGALTMKGKKKAPRNTRIYMKLGENLEE
jgi:hypothetical protein